MISSLTAGVFTSLLAIAAAQICIPGPVDVMFVVSSSAVLTEQQFNDKIKVIENFVMSVNIGPNDVRVGLITEYDYPDLEFHMNDHMDKNELQMALRFTYFNPGDTKFGSALEYIQEFGMDDTLGGRQGVQNVVIFLTNDVPIDSHVAQSAAIKLTTEGTIVIGVGSGDVHRRRLIGIASGCHYVVTGPPFSPETYSSFAIGALNRTCDAVKGVDVKECECDLVGDVVFLLDASGDQGKDNFEKQMTFAQQLVQELPIGKNATRVSAMTYTQSDHPIFNLNHHTDKTELLLALGFLPFQGEDDRNPVDGLTYILDNSYIPGDPAREPVQKIVVVTATGPLGSPSLAAAEADKLRNAGIKVLSLGVGPTHQNELLAMAYDTEHVEYFTGFDTLIDGAADMAQLICQDRTIAPTGMPGTTPGGPVCMGIFPCQNGGTCVQDQGGFERCVCRPDWSGTVCHIHEPACMGIFPCLNGGTCVEVDGIEQCQCTPGYGGAVCHDVVPTPAPTQSDIICMGLFPCQNGGICEVVDGLGNEMCVCPAGFTGVVCHDVDHGSPTAAPATTPGPNECSFNPCHNGGTCFLGTDGKLECKCPDRYGGSACYEDLWVSTTTLAPYTAAPTGPTPSRDPYTCDFNPCFNGGTCYVANGRFLCSCPVGFTGSACFEELIITTTTPGPTLTVECPFNPCYNGATCVLGSGDHFVCLCQPGYTGDACYDRITTTVATVSPTMGSTTPPTTPAPTLAPSAPTTTPEPCQFNPCYNGGSCSKQGDMYACDCMPTFTGPTCFDSIVTTSAPAS